MSLWSCYVYVGVDGYIGGYDLTNREAIRYQNSGFWGLRLGCVQRRPQAEIEGFSSPRVAPGLTGEIALCMNEGKFQVIHFLINSGVVSGDDVMLAAKRESAIG